MRKLLLTLVSVLAVLPLGAKQIDLITAKDVANRFVRENSRLKSLANGGDLVLAYTANTGNVNNFYVYNLAKGGFVIVSADDCVEQVLGYSENGSFDINAIPDNMRDALEEYKREINYAIEHSAISMGSALALPDMAAEKSPVAPLLTTKWNQGAPYNNKCPMYDTERRCVTGCTATAMAQVMNYFEWPKTGKGSCSYTTAINGTDTNLSLDFSTITFDWDNMLDVYGSSATDAQNDAVATLMYSVGVGAKMSYGLSSGASFSNAYKALIGNFDYDKTLQYISRDYYSPSEWNNLIYNEVANGRPVLYAGYNSSSGHAYVCDGYSSDNFFHINWGWGGMSDGYFKLSALNPSGQGIGGSDSGYNSGQEIIYGFAPNKGTTEFSYAVGYDGDFSCSATDVAALDVPDTQITFNVGEILYQYCPASMSCILDLGVDVVNDNTNKSNYISCTKMSIISNYDYYFSSFGCSATEFTRLGDGTYTIYPAFNNTALGKSGRVMVPYGKQKAVKLTVSGGALSFSGVVVEQPSIKVESISTEANFYTNKPYKLNVKVSSTGADFIGDLYAAVINSSGSLLCYAYNTFEVLTGETVTNSIVGDLSNVTAGTYNLAICTRDGNSLHPISTATITINEEPGEFSLSNEGFSFDSKIYSNEFKTVCSVKNTGGLFGGALTCLVYCNGTYATQIDSDYCLIDQDVTKPVVFTGSFDGEAGAVCHAYLFYYKDSRWYQVGGGTPFTLSGVSGIEDVKADAAADVVVYPNPADDVVYVQSPSAMGSINVFSLSGKQVIVANAEGAQSTSLQVDNLPSGVYVIKITTDEGVVVRRMIKK